MAQRKEVNAPETKSAAKTATAALACKMEREISSIFLFNRGDHWYRDEKREAATNRYLSKRLRKALSVVLDSGEGAAPSVVLGRSLQILVETNVGHKRVTEILMAGIPASAALHLCLAKHPSEKKRLIVARDKKTPAGALRLLAEDPALWEPLATNPTTPDDVVEKLLFCGRPAIEKLAAGRRNLPPELVKKRLHHIG